MRTTHWAACYLTNPHSWYPVSDDPVGHTSSSTVTTCADGTTEHTEDEGLGVNIRNLKIRGRRMSTTAFMTEGGLGRGCCRKARKILNRPSRRRGRHCSYIFNFYHKVLQSWLPLERFEAFFCKVLMMAIYQRTSSFFMTLTHPKTKIFLMKVMGNLTLMIWMTVSVYPSFVFVRVTFPSFVRPYIFLTTLYVNKEQYAMELKGCVPM